MRWATPFEKCLKGWPDCFIYLSRHFLPTLQPPGLPSCHAAPLTACAHTRHPCRAHPFCFLALALQEAFPDF